MNEQGRRPEGQGNSEIGAIELLPKLLDPSTTTMCWGIRNPSQGRPVETDLFNMEGIILTPAECVVAYADRTRDDVFRAWIERGNQSVHLSGGFGNPMTMEYNFLSSLPSSPFDRRKIRDIKEVLKSSNRPPAYYDYLGAFRRQAEKKGIAIDTIDDTRINEVLGWPATEYWELMASVGEKSINLGKITSRPFVTAYGNAFFVVEKQPEFGGKAMEFTVSNTTGAGGLDTKLGNHLMVLLTEGEGIAKERYIKEAEFTARMLKGQGKPIPFDETKLDSYAEAFVQSARIVKQDFERVFGIYKVEDLKGIQFAFSTFATDGLGVAVYSYPTNLPYAFVKDAKGVWKKAVA